MISKIDRNKDRKKRHQRVRGKRSGTSARVRISGTAERPRLNVYRSVENIYAQVIDDVAGTTLCASSSLDKVLKAELSGLTKKEQAKLVGQDVAKKAIAKGVEAVVFDRGGYLYTGRVQSLADGAREAGLKF